MIYFNFPKEWKVDSFIPKEVIYRNIGADEKLKKLFVESIERVKLKYILNYENTNIDTYIEGSERYEEINFITIELRRFGNEDKIAKIFHSFIPKATVLVFQYENQILLSTAIKTIDKNIKIEKMYNTSWFIIENQPEFIQSLNMKGYNSINLKEFYDSILDRVKAFKILGEDLEGKKLETEKLDKLIGLKEELEEMKIKMKKESQLNRRVELSLELKKKVLQLKILNIK